MEENGGGPFKPNGGRAPAANGRSDRRDPVSRVI